MRLASVRIRLTFWSMGVQALILAAMGASLWYVVHANLLSSLDREMERRAHAIINRRLRQTEFRPGNRFPNRDRDLRVPDAPGASETRPETIAARTDPPETAAIARPRMRLLTLQGRGWDSEEPMAPWDARAFTLSAAGQEIFTNIRAQGQSLRLYSFPLRRGGEVVGVGQMVDSLQEIHHELAGLTRALLTLIPLALLVTGLSGAFQTDRMLRPLRRITQTAARVGAADLSERLPTKGEDEFALLARTFNGMLARLEQAFEQQRRFTADASHELRTPLTAIKAHTSLALSEEKTPAEYRVALEGANRAAARMSRIIQDLLLLTRLDADKRSVTLGPVSLAKVLESALEMMAGYERAPITLEGIPPEIQVMGEAGQLTRLFTNLLENAVRYTPPEGHIALRVQNEGEWVRVQVADTGCGIAPEHLPHLCERFYRVDAARSRKQGGTGLGLAICQGIVEAHGGRMEFESVLGEGTTVQVFLPSAS